MRIDHLALRTKCKDKSAKFFMDAFGYKFQAEFDIFFNDEKTDVARCIALEPPEKISSEMPFVKHFNWLEPGDAAFEFHCAPEIFISEGSEGSIVANWVKARGGIGGLHHIAYNCDDVEAKRKEWIEKGWGSFTSEHAFKCDGLTQIFTLPNYTGIIFEFIERKGHGFCKENVASLMKSTAQIDSNMKS